jgi:hypothetical protein
MLIKNTWSAPRLAGPLARDIAQEPYRSVLYFQVLTALILWNRAQWVCLLPLWCLSGHHTKREKALSLALDRFAGRRATFIMHVDQLRPSPTRVKCAAWKDRLLPCLREPDESTIARNMMEVVLLPRADWGTRRS